MMTGDYGDHEECLTARMIGAEALALVAVAIFCGLILIVGAIVDDARQCGAAIFASEEMAQ